MDTHPLPYFGVQKRFSHLNIRVGGAKAWSDHLPHKIFFKVAPNRYELKHGKSKKLSPRFCSPFEIVKIIR